MIARNRSRLAGPDYKSTPPPSIPPPPASISCDPSQMADSLDIFTFITAFMALRALYNCGFLTVGGQFENPRFYERL